MEGVCTLKFQVNNPLPECQFEGIFLKITSGIIYCIFQDFSLKQHILRGKFKKIMKILFPENTVSRAKETTNDGDISRV